jgi:hypothetical protein
MALRYDAKTFPEKGPRGDAFRAFHKSVQIPEDARPVPQVVIRSGRAARNGRRRRFWGLFGIEA